MGLRRTKRDEDAFGRCREINDLWRVFNGAVLFAASLRRWSPLPAFSASPCVLRLCQVKGTLRLAALAGKPRTLRLVTHLIFSNLSRLFRWFSCPYLR